MSYIDVYFKRVFGKGDTVAEIAQSSGEQSFLMWLQNTPHRVDNLSVERGIYFSAIILTLKDNVGKKTMTLNVARDIPIRVGDILNWDNDGCLEKWILWRKERKVNETYQTFEIIKCNHYLKWIDSDGFRKGSWVYFTSSMDSKIKENFRTWHSLITPQYNKFAEVIMPTYEIDRQTKFIIESEGWYVIEFDKSSVDGIIYLSLSEDKVNTFYDDLQEEIACIDTEAKYEIMCSEKEHQCAIGETINPIYSILKNGLQVEEEFIIESENDKIVNVIDGAPKAISEGKVNLILMLKKNPDIKLYYPVNVNGFSNKLAYISGDAEIRNGRACKFTVVYNKRDADFEFSIIEGEDLVKISEVTKNTCTLVANEKSKLGYVTLNANNQFYNLTKRIKIVPLW